MVAQYQSFFVGDNGIIKDPYAAAADNDMIDRKVIVLFRRFCGYILALFGVVFGIFVVGADKVCAFCGDR